MRILLVHNSYRWSGGEDSVFRSEAALLERHGHEVHRLAFEHEDLKKIGSVSLAARTFWSRSAERLVHETVKKHAIEVVHFHNILPLVSPSAFYGARRAGAAVVNSLHNHRLVCPSGLMLREGRHCDDCADKRIAWPAIEHACYRQSRCASGAVALMVAGHRMLGTWAKAVDVYIAPSQSLRSQILRSGLSPEKVVVKPHFVLDAPQVGSGCAGNAIFVGRLSQEKGLDVLLDAWRRIKNPPLLRIIGDGPLARHLEQDVPGIEWAGWMSHQELFQTIGRSVVLIAPSICHEAFGLVLIEALAVGTPVIASDAGAMAEIVTPSSGILFPVGDAGQLALAVERLLSSEEHLVEMRAGARAQFLENYTAERNYTLLIDVYQQAIARRKQSVD